MEVDDRADVGTRPVDLKMNGQLARWGPADRGPVPDAHTRDLVGSDRDPARAVRVHIRDVALADAQVAVHVEEAGDRERPARRGDLEGEAGRAPDAHSVLATPFHLRKSACSIPSWSSALPTL